MDKTYHCCPHEDLQGKDLQEKTPLEYWRKNRKDIKPLDLEEDKINEIFCHHYECLVQKDRVINWKGKAYKVSNVQAGEKVELVIDPYTETVIKVKSIFGNVLEFVGALDEATNDKATDLERKPHQPHSPPKPSTESKMNLAEFLLKEYGGFCNVPRKKKR